MKIVYPIVHALFYTFSLLPFRVLYFISDCLYPLIYYVIRYRRKVVRNNLVTSLPEKSPDEIKDIERRSYHFLCDYFVETIKLLSISEKSMRKHIEFDDGLELIQQCYDKGQSVSAMMGHHGNWEYLTSLNLFFDRHSDVVLGLIYHPLRNKAFDQLFLDIRQHLGGLLIAKNDILRKLVTFKREKRIYLMGYISDQAPKWNNIHLWLPFLHHDTPVFTNGERIMRKTDTPVFFFEMERPKRGKYFVRIKPITYTPNKLDDNAITRRFFEMLEEAIHRNPHLYLWTHNRWKRTHEEFDKNYVMVGNKVIAREQYEAQKTSGGQPS